MSFFDTLRLSWRRLLRHKLRSFLTMLGIVVGVAAVICMLAIATGARNKVQQRIAAMGTNAMYVYPAWRGVTSGPSRRVPFTLAEMDAIRRQCPAVAAVSPVVYGYGKFVHGHHHNSNGNVMGVNSSYPEIRRAQLSKGRFISDADVHFGASVCVLGDKLATDLFEQENPVGETLRIGNLPFVVVGVLAARGEYDRGDNDALLPYTTVMRRMHTRSISHLLVSARTMEACEDAEKQIKALIRSMRKQRPDEKDTIDFSTQAEWQKSTDESFAVFTVLVGCVAGISLIVGGIGIMNIMLVSLSERIREIGIHMSLGARGRDVLAAFFTEAMLLCVMGGLLGVGVGYEIAHLMGTWTKWTIEVTPGSIELGFGFAVGVGLIFGIYPATRASRLDPIEALRTD